jgi:hypothetical protein
MEAPLVHLHGLSDGPAVCVPSVGEGLPIYLQLRGRKFPATSGTTASAAKEEDGAEVKSQFIHRAGAEGAEDRREDLDSSADLRALRGEGC